MRKVFTLLSLFFVFTLKGFAQTDMPNPPSDFQIIPAGSWVVAMDTAHQKWPAVGQTIFNLKSYGLINQFLQNQFPVKWAIQAGKSLNGIDFSASAYRVYPTTTTPAMLDFRGGPFIIPDTTICGLTTQDLIQNFGSNVCVYRLVNSEIIDIRYEINNAPKIAIFTNGGNQNIHAKILIAAGIPNYQFLDAANIGSLSNCFTLVSEPHWDFSDADSVVVNGVKNFVINGGNFFAQCQALETYENWGFFASTTGINILNRNVLHMYHNADLPILQINGLVTENQGGSVRNWALKPGSIWKSTTYKVISHLGGDTLVSIGMHLAPPNVAGGNAFLLGSHDYYSLTNLKAINALRMYLNAAIMPSPNNHLWARAGMDQSLACSGTISLGCPPTGPPGSSYSWTPSSGLSCTNCSNPVANPASTTNYTVTVTNASGCTMTDKVLITSTLTYPVAGFSMNGGAGVSACVNAPVSFTDHSTNGATTLSWDFGDGFTSNLQNPSHTYTIKGSYTVTLTATNAMGCTSSAQQAVTVNPIPVVDFAYWPACAGHQICFGNSSSISSGSITGWSWNFGDIVPATNTSTLQSPCHLFSVTNTNVTLTATSNAGCQSVVSKPITLSPDPVAAFNSTNSCETTPTCFTDLSTVSSGSIVSWNWSFIDPISGVTVSSTSQNPCNLYTNYSGMTAQLVIVTDSGCSDTITQPVSFRPMPVADFTSNSLCQGGLTCFNNLSSISSGAITNYQWFFGEPGSGTGDTSSVLNPCRTYMTGGIYSTSLVVTSNLGCQNTAIVSTEVFHRPVVDFTPSFACFGIQNCFTNLSSVASGTITNYNWSMTDLVTGVTDTSTMQSPCYTISTYNPHDITLILTTDHGCGDTLSKTVSVSEVPHANFSSAVVCPGGLTCFSDVSTIATGSIAAWNWNFSDPLTGPLNTSNSQNPCHTFIAPSPLVTLTVTSDIGCQNTITQPIGFNPAPVSDFTWTPTCNGASTSFSNASSAWSGTIVGISWDFGEPSSGLADSSLLSDPIHTYSSANTFNVTLTTTSSNGCQNSLTRTVTVDPVPVANFSTTPVCQSNQTCFTNLTTIASGTIATHVWTFGDSGSGALNFSSQKDECHIYNTIGTDTVTLIEVSDKGCSDTISSVVTVSPEPIANFNSNIVCPGTTTCFSDLSTIPSGSITGWNWNFSDPSSGSNSSSVQNPCHVFQNTSAPFVSLIVTSNAGCKDTVSSPASFHTVPLPDFSTATVCLGQSTCFTDLSSISTGSITNVHWTFDEPSSGAANNSLASNPCHTYAGSGTFNVMLDVTTDMGCRDSITKQVDVSPIPSAHFSAPRTCDGNQTCFNNTSTVGTGTIISYAWDFGDPGSGANSSAAQSPCHLYSTLNPYNVKLVVTSANGCKDSVTSSFAKSPLPVANFSSNIVCPGSATCFTNLSSISSGTITGFQWNFSDPVSGGLNSSSISNPCHTFINKSNPNVILTLTSDSGCQATFSTPVSFHPVPVTDFYFFPVCLGTPSCFSDVSTVSSGSLVSHQWTFGEPSSGAANSSTATNVCHTYSNPGLYDVTLTVTTDMGCQRSFTKHPGVTPIPTAAFSATRTCEGDQTCFTDLSTVGLGTIISYAWDFDDPGPGINNSSLQNPCYTYSSLSTHNVKLVVTSDNGCSDSITSPFALSPLPLANFSSTVACPGTATCFTNLSSIPSGTITGYQWNFSDIASGAADSSSSQNPCHTFINVSNPNVILTLTSDSGCVQSFTSPVSFHPVPLPDFNFNIACLGTQSCFTDLSSVASGTINNLQWTFGEPSSGASDNSVANNPCHTYATPGTFDVVLDITTDLGCRDSITKQVDVSPIPTASFSTNTTCEGSSACFNDLSTAGTGTITSYTWDFGDPGSGANSSAMQSPCHLYSTLNPYNVKLAVTSSNGCKDSVTSSFALSPLPVANFSSNIVCPGSATCFTDLSSIPSGTITGYQWNFSDIASGVADTSSSQNPCHTFINVSNPNVVLTLTSDSGCVQSFTSPVNFHPVPLPDFNFNIACLGTQSCFTDLSSVVSGTINNLQWTFGEPSSGAADNSVANNPCHTYSSPGTFNVILNLTTDMGCQDSIIKQVDVAPIPTASFGSNKTCEGSSACFNDLSTAGTGTITSYIWNFGDPASGTNNSSPVQNACHLYSTLSAHSIKLVVTSNNGCSDSITSSFALSPLPVVNFSSTVECPGTATCFTDLSSIPSGTITSYQWNFSDPASGVTDSSSSQNPCHTFINTSNPNVMLTLTSDSGCVQSFTSPVSFHPVPLPDFNFNIACLGTQSCFTDLSSVASGTINNLQWTFGEPSSGAANNSVTNNPCHTFASPGTFDVVLNLTSDMGCRDSVIKQVDVAPIPTASFGTNKTCEGSSACFNDLSTAGTGTITSYTWDFGDPASGTNNASPVQNPCHLYSTLSAHNITLVVTSNNGCSDSVTAPFALSPLPVVNFSSTVECPGTTTCFTDLSSIPSGTITGYQWNFSDIASGAGDTSSSQNPCHTFINVSNPNVMLTLTSDSGCVQSFNSPVTFHPVPLPDFNFNIACLGTQSCFTDLSSVASGTINSLQWTFGEPSSGAADNSVVNNPCHTYGSSGTFDVILNLTTDMGCQDSITKQVDVSPIPTASFGTNTTCEGSSACFSDLSTAGTGTITSYTWDFGDPASGTNNSSPVQNPCHLYSTLSAHNITLVVTSNNGCSDSVTAPFALSPLPVVDFSSTVECPGTTTCFTDLSSIPSGNITGYQWNFSDIASGASDTSSSQNPCHTFINVSNPNVMLTLTSDSGCVQSFTSPVTFHPIPVPNFVSPTSCFGSQTCFINVTSVSTGSIAASQWNFGDVSSGSLNYSSSSSDCHNFSTDGTYNVTLTETSDNGCIDSISQQVIISPRPIAAFNSSNVCMGAQSCFNDQSSVQAGNIISWDWDFGDPGSGTSNVSGLQGPCHMFNTLNPYDVRLIVTTGDGCKDTLNALINVSPVPVATFSSTTVCPEVATCFSDMSTITSGSITGWKWNFSGSTISDSSSMQNPCYMFSESPATASLTVTSNMGCQNTFGVPVNFNPVPVPDFSASSSCIGTPTCLNNLSTIAQGTITGYAWNFGDAGSGANNSSSTASPCHDFSAANSFNINLSVTSDLGCTKTVSRSITVHQPPSANFSASPVCINSPTEFINQSISQQNDSIREWRWNFDDGSNSNVRSPSHLFNLVRTFNVSLITTALTGCSDTIVIPVTIHAKPQANISTPQEGCGSICGTINDLSLPIEGSITSRQWTFQGGNPYSSTLKNPNVCYTAKGLYPVKLIVTNTFGCADTLYSTQHMKVYPSPEADFYITKEPADLLAPELSLGHMWSYDVVKWYWDFGDLSPIDSANQDPSHTYRAATLNNDVYTFRVSLNVKNQFGCVSRISREINIKPAFSFYIPNTFTPNGDFPNDVFFGKGRGISEYKISIFDRWGLMLWQCEEKGDYREWDKDNGEGLPSACKWDGVYRGSTVQNDTYVWKVEFKNVFGENFKYIGHVNVIK